MEENMPEDEKKPESLSFTDQVNDAVKGMTQNDKGIWDLPENVSEEVRVAAMSEKRLRDVQASYVKVDHENKALKAEKSVLLQKATENVKLNLTAEQTEELEELKFSDPEAWRNKINTYETEALIKHTEVVNEEVKKVSSSSLEKEELEQRKHVLKEFQNQNPDFVLNDDVIANDIPPRITKKLENRSVTFEQFLNEVNDYLKTGKVIKQEEVPNQPNLSKVSGKGKPDKAAVNEDINQSYAKETY